jgi:Ca2+-binding RTX toxin-like protein
MAKGGTTYKTTTTRLLAGAAVLLFASTAHADFDAAYNLGALNIKDGFRVNGNAVGDRLGQSVGPAGDVNGDGIDDLLLGAEQAAGNAANAGAGYVIFGRATGFGTLQTLSSLDGTNGLKLNGVAGPDDTGTAVSAAGDVNGDGLDDLMVTAANTSEGGSSAGTTYVVFGSTSPFPSVLDLSSLDGTNGFRIVGNPSERSGNSVAGGGDINGDGLGDIIIGAPYASGYSGNPGAAYVVHGRANGFPSVVHLSALGAGKVTKLAGASDNERAGDGVSFAGDFNGDGTDDVIVGAPTAGPNGIDSGRSYIVFGKPGGLASQVQLSALGAGTGVKLNGPGVGDYSGFAVGGGGDVNGDGFSDVIIGAHYSDDNGNNSGTSFVVFGKAGGSGAAIELSSLNGSDGFAVIGIGSAGFDGNSGYSVAHAGDMNGDGFDDLISGAPEADGAAAAAGTAHVVFGKVTGFGSTLQLSSLNGSDGFRLNGAVADDTAGHAVAAAGDINFDGLSDVVVGSEQTNSAAGAVWVIYGQRPADAVTALGSAAAQYMAGSTDGDTLSGAGGNDVLEGHLGADILKGNGGSNTASYEHATSSSGTIVNLSNAAANTGHAQGDTYSAIQNLLGSRFNDTLTGNGGNNRIDGHFGDDTLKGGKGNDVLIGGMGKDTQAGGGGKDTFRFRYARELGTGANADQINDFKPGTSSTAIDKIDVSGIDAKTATEGNQSFKFIGTKSFTKAGQLRIKKSGNNLVLQGHTGGSKAPEFEIVLKGLKKPSAFTAKDFKL